MDYNKIVSVSGLPGLFEMLSSKADGAVLKSLDDNTSKFVSSRQHNFSHLESIEVYTTKDNTNLAEVFEAMKKSEEKLPDEKATSKDLKDYFEKVFPGLDHDRVYTSDMKKMVKWYAILHKNKIDFNTKTPEEGGNVPEVKNIKPTHVDNTHVKPQQLSPKKIESRGVK